MGANPVIRRNHPLTLPTGLLCGVDEAGRGPIAGPVSAAAVILHPRRPIVGLMDSKKLSPQRRDALALQIRAQAHAWCVAWASVEEIDDLNILRASLLAMQRAVKGLSVRADAVWVDGLYCPEVDIPSIAVVAGDDRVAAIQAASILAKTERDALMMRLAEEYPQYEFDRHKGYPTPVHLHLLRQHGACPQHRRSFAPVAALLAAEATAL